MAQTIEHCFSEEKIVALLARKRVAASRKTRKEVFFQQASDSSAQKPKPPALIYELMPPRQNWPRPSKSNRDDPASSSTQAQARSLAQFAMRMFRDPSKHYRWIRNLRRFVNDIKTRGLNWSDGDLYGPLRIVVKPKKGRDFRGKSRVLTLYGLSDNILATCFAGYLREQIDPFLADEVLAFRAMAGGQLPNHHDAIRSIKLFREQQKEDTLIWVAECDIKGFFDAVAHRTVVDEVRNFCKTNKITLDNRASAFLRSFLAGYSYTNYAEPRARFYLQQLGLNAGQIQESIPQPVDALAEMGINSHGNHGIPQGSAMSCILANIVLSRADEAVKRQLAPRGKRRATGIYARYCDDIIILNTDIGECEAGLGVYLKVLRELKLPYHEPATISRYGIEFWKRKSKKPYRWGIHNSGSSPWLSFVGYQIHRDGRIRVRKDSIDKEIKKQKHAVRQVFKHLYARMTWTSPADVPNSIAYRSLHHLISFGVGNPSSKYFGPAHGGKSWARGFEEIKGNIENSGMRRLDQARNRIVQTQKQHLNYLVDKNLISPQLSRRRRSESEILFMGRPFAYAFQFTSDKLEAIFPTNLHRALSLRKFTHSVRKLMALPKAPPPQ